VNNRRFLFLMAWFMELAMIQVMTAVPFLAVRLGASRMMLGMIGTVSMLASLPFTFTSGRLSEIIGRKRLIVPAAALVAAASFALLYARSPVEVMIAYSLAAVFCACYFPPLEAMIGGISRPGELAGNMSQFNLGWCIGRLIGGFLVLWLIGVDLTYCFYAGAALAIVPAFLGAIYRSEHAIQEELPDDHPSRGARHVVLLSITRISNFVAFFALTVASVLFARFGKDLGWSEPRTAAVVVMLSVGMGVFMIVTSVSPWWKGKLWPMIATQSTLVVSAVCIVFSSSPILMGVMFFFLGGCAAVTYAAALYQSLTSRQDLGTNTGIHEMLIVLGALCGSLLGGAVAQLFESNRAPYVLIAVLATLGVVVSLWLWTRNAAQRR